MFVSLRKIVVTVGNADKVVQQFSKKGIIEEQEGFVDLTIMQQKARNGEEEVVLMIRWESEDYWKQWERSDAHLAGHKARRGQPKPEYILRQEGGRYHVKAVKRGQNS
ncbi:antibiotic biosynthesis monooxygenase [Ornithinibacillus sp. L9]|uniref:Antibiotic biosynthesis monooxygenase n=1 Tax=Ornithinibacillus caprae TaxID=2678566 RepID=A0A6N8FLX1_9BACI|nr:antibiotic biosynthesis monooxygenase [Ornithinibacillus caprae]